MALIFGNDLNLRGCFHAFRFKGGGSRGAVLKLPAGGELPWSPDFADPLLVTGFSYNQQEAVSFVKVFGDRVYTYAFGHDPNPSILTVNFMTFLIDKTDYSGIVDIMNQKYKDNRVSVTPQYAFLGLGNSKPLKGFIIGMRATTADSEHSLQQYGITLALVEAQ